MFAPLGYITLADVRHNLAGEAEKWRLSRLRHEASTSDSSFGEIMQSSPTNLRSIAYIYWLFQCFLNRHESQLFAAFPNGNLVSLSLDAVKRRKIYNGSFPEAYDDCKKLIDHVEDTFLYICETTCLIDVNLVDKRHKSNSSELIKAALESLHACPVCWKMPAGTIDWMEICGVSENLTGDFQDMSAKAIAIRILSEKSCDPSLTREEIKERVAPTVSYGRFRQSWSLAAEQDPSISKPGRKS